MIDPRRRFGPLAETYSRSRPSYPAELVDWILEQAGLPRERSGTGSASGISLIADVGCGTGIASRLFASRGFTVIGIDPSQQMLAQARQAGGADYRTGDAAHTGLEDASIALVTVAQALHWFDLEVALSEFRRILQPGAPCAAFWNQRARSPFLDAYDELLRRHSREYTPRERARLTLQALRRAPLVATWSERTFRNRQRLDRPGLSERTWSSSYVAHGVSDREAFDRELNALFDQHEQSGTVEFLYEVPAAVFRLHGPEAARRYPDP